MYLGVNFELNLVYIEGIVNSKCLGKNLVEIGGLELKNNGKKSQFT